MTIIPKHQPKSEAETHGEHLAPQTDRRGFMKLIAGGVGAIGLGAIGMTQGIFGLRLRQKLTGPDFNEQEVTQVGTMLDAARSHFPLNRYGHINLPFFIDEEGGIRIQTVDTSTIDGWDCFDSSVELAATLSKAGFSSGVALCRDELNLFGTHFFPYIEKNNVRFSLDITPPYYHHNTHFDTSTLGHSVDNAHAYSPSAPLKTKRVLQKEHGEKESRIISHNVYPADYLEIPDDQGVKGFLFSVSFDQGSAPGAPISVDGGPIRTYISVIAFDITLGPDGAEFIKKAEYPFEFDERDSRLIPIRTLSFQEGHLDNEVFRKAREVGSRFSTKMRNQLQR